jgi:hypothetical protein
MCSAVFGAECCAVPNAKVPCASLGAWRLAGACLLLDNQVRDPTSQPDTHTRTNREGAFFFLTARVGVGVSGGVDARYYYYTLHTLAAGWSAVRGGGGGRGRGRCRCRCRCRCFCFCSVLCCFKRTRLFVLGANLAKPTDYGTRQARDLEVH